MTQCNGIGLTIFRMFSNAQNQIPSFLRLLNVFEPKKGARNRLKNIGHSEHCWTYLPLENIRNILKPLLLFWIIAIPEASNAIYIETLCATSKPRTHKHLSEPKPNLTSKTETTNDHQNIAQNTDLEN